MKIYLSSAEQPYNFKVLSSINKKLTVLLSFYYLRTKSDKFIKNVLATYKKMGCDMMLDSGAYSFLTEFRTKNNLKTTSPQKKITKTNVSLDQYFEEYLVFLKVYGDFFTLIVELDVDLVVGYTKILGWRLRLLQIIPIERQVWVFHHTIPDCLKEIKKWCKSGVVIGIGSLTPEKIIGFIFKHALSNKVRVHGFALTRNDYLLKYPWYSVDSSSWNTGQRFGVLGYYNSFDYKIRLFRFSELKKGNTYQYQKFLKEVFPKISSYLKISILEILKHNRNSIFLDICNAQAYMKQAEDLTRLWKVRGITFNS